MKNSLSFISLFLFSISFSSVYSQVSFEIQGGISNTNILSDKNQNANFRTDLNTYAGTSLRFSAEDRINFQLDFLYEKKGANYVDDQYQSIFGLQYLSLSPIVNIELSKSLDIFIGPYFSYRLRENHEVNGVEIVLDRFDYLTHSDDMGLRSGFKFKFDQFFFQMCYSFGLKDIRSFNFDSPFEGPVFPEGLYNKSFSLGLGFTFTE